jgi:putative addiction module component (TIGR02574 family)
VTVNSWFAGLGVGVYNHHMSDRAQALLREVLTLPPDERADLAAELLASLDDSAVEDPVAVQAAWAREIEKRGRRAMAGESSGEPWEDVRDRISKRLTQR